MANEKVILPREVAEAIEGLKSQGWTKSGIFGFSTGVKRLALSIDEESYGKTIGRYFGCMKHDLLMEALVNGYEVESSPEDQVKEFYEVYDACDSSYRLGIREGVRQTLNLLGIKIEGVNAE
jgi:hypothetical protein